MLNPTYYRLRQFIGGLRATVQAAEVERLKGILPATAQPLFMQMPVDAQRHSLNVLTTLQHAGHTNADLAVAALLHDVGKNAVAQANLQFNLWWRGPLVVVEAWAPALLRRLASPDVAHGWRYVIHVQLTHPAIGAEWAQAAGCPPLACWLIRHHQDQQVWAATEQEMTLLRTLQWADGQN